MKFKYILPVFCFTLLLQRCDLPSGVQSVKYEYTEPGSTGNIKITDSARTGEELLKKIKTRAKNNFK